MCQLYTYASDLKIAIIGRNRDTANYENALAKMGVSYRTTMDMGRLSDFDGLLLPGGGDITPAFFGECNEGSKKIDTELDILQLTALEYAVQHRMPVLGICKGMQLINVAFGGSITQHLSTAHLHEYQEGDQYHDTVILESSCLYLLYGSEIRVNSAHHQGINKLGTGLDAIQWCKADGCVEAIIHDSLPVLGLQWHPERLDSLQSPLNSGALLALFSSWLSAAHGDRFSGEVLRRELRPLPSSGFWSNQTKI